MTPITIRLQQLDPSLVFYVEGNWKEPPHSTDDVKGKFLSFNDAGVECETGEFLYSMIRLLKPSRVLETGTHVGVGAAYMGLALQDNNKGYLDTYEFLPPNYEAAKARMERMGLLASLPNGTVKTYLADVRTILPATTYELILLDTEPQTRFDELVRFAPLLADGGFVFIHDLNGHMAQVENFNPDHPDEPLWPWGPLPEQIKQWVRDDVLRPFHFATPRGLTGFYKPRPSDYVWK